MLVSQLDEKNIVTIEGVGSVDKLHPIQEEFVKRGAIQCGFCTPGMVLSTIDLLKRNRHPNRKEIREGIGGNICRCTGYQKIVDAVESASRRDLDLDSFSNFSKKLHLIRENKFQEKARVFLPENLDELLEILDSEDDFVIFSGGTDVLTKRRKGIIPKNKNLICIERIKELKSIHEDNNWVFIGAAVTHVSILESKIIQQNFPVLIKAIRCLGSPQIRHMGTIGGNICTASPAGDTLPPLYVLDAVLDIRSKKARREIPIKDFIKAPGKIELNKNEILYGIKIRKNSYNLQHYEKVGQRNALSISIAGVAVVAQISEEEIIEKIKIAWGSVGPTIIESKEIENKLYGEKLNKKTIKSVFPLIEETLSPIDDVRATKDYRMSISKNLLLRLIK
jgi:xanthine dehydrogenase small subunit